MGYNTKAVIRDLNKKIVPQYFNPATDSYEPLHGQHGTMRVVLYDSEGREVVAQTFLDAILAKIDELVEAVS